MPGCCLGAIVFFFGPRVMLALAWLFSDWYRAFSSTLIALLGFVFLPWTSLAWMYIFFRHHGSTGDGYVLLLAAGVLADFSAYGGSHAARRRVIVYRARR
jgi:hypothetical protein